MLTVLIFLNTFYGFTLTATAYIFHKEGKAKSAILSMALLALTIANVAVITTLV